MKRILVLLLCMAMALPLLSGCAKEMTDEEMLAMIDEDKILERAEEILAQRKTAAPEEATPQPTESPTAQPTAQPTPEPEPEPESLAPKDLLGEEYNPFYDVAFPEGYTAYGAIFDTGDAEKNVGPNYVLLMTAEGDPEEIVRFVSKLAGFDDEDSVNGFLEGIHNENHCFIDGMENGKGMAIIVQVKGTSSQYSYDQCDEVDGCRLELTALIGEDEVAGYGAFIADNYNPNMLSGMADSFADTLASDTFSISANIQRDGFNSVYVVHRVEDAAGLRDRMAEELKYDWYDAGENRMGITYGRISSEISFNIDNNEIYINQNLNDAQSPSGAYVTAEVSLQTLGFAYSQEDALCIYEDRENGVSVAIHRPEWRQLENDWNVEFLYEMNGYLMAVWFTDSRQIMKIQINKGSSEASYQYDMAKDQYGEEYPGMETVKELFGEAFGVPDSGEYDYPEAIDKMNGYLRDTFGMTLEELYGLPIV